jgi:acetyl esterase/lipase
MTLISQSLWAAATIFAASFTPMAAQAQFNSESTVPAGYNSACNCYRNVPYGSTTWIEPTTKKLAKQVMDVWMPPKTFSGPRPIAYYGHPNGGSNTIAKDITAGSLYMRLVKPLTDRGFVVVSYEFRHPVVNYIAGSPTPRYDIQKAINYFVNNHAAALNADPTNSFISGQSRGGGLGILTALTGKLPGTTVRAMWTYQAQTTFNCTEMANTFVIPSERTAFMTQCTAVPDAGSSLQSVTASAPPIVAEYDRPFNMVQVPAAKVDVHYPDFGYQLCQRYAAIESASQCDGRQSVTNETAWIGMADFFSAHMQ